MRSKIESTFATRVLPIHPGASGRTPGFTIAARNLTLRLVYE